MNNLFEDLRRDYPKWLKEFIKKNNYFSSELVRNNISLDSTEFVPFEQMKSKQEPGKLGIVVIRSKPYLLNSRNGQQFLNSNGRYQSIERASLKTIYDLADYYGYFKRDDTREKKRADRSNSKEGVINRDRKNYIDRLETTRGEVLGSRYDSIQPVNVDLDNDDVQIRRAYYGNTDKSGYENHKSEAFPNISARLVDKLNDLMLNDSASLLKKYSDKIDNILNKINMFSNFKDLTVLEKRNRAQLLHNVYSIMSDIYYEYESLEAWVNELNKELEQENPQSWHIEDCKTEITRYIKKISWHLNSFKVGNFKVIWDLKESLLLEGKNLVQTLEKYKDKIPEETATELISWDPTFEDNGSTTGTYGEWLLNKFNKKWFTLDDKFTIISLLDNFEEYKKFLQNKDINSYKSIDELNNVINQAIEVAANTEESKSHRNKRLRKSYGDAELIYNDNKWEIWTPHTYEASTTLGKGACWCTAHTDTREWYDKYTYNGKKLYIFIDKSDRSKKYQFGCRYEWLDDYCEFNDKNNRHVDMAELTKDDKPLQRFLAELGLMPKQTPIFILDGEKAARNNLIKVEGVELIKILSGVSTIPENCNILNDKNVRKVKNIIIEEGPEIIDYCAFKEMRDLKAIKLPNSIRIINRYAFSSSIKDIFIPKTIKAISRECFYEPGYLKRHKINIYCDNKKVQTLFSELKQVVFKPESEWPNQPSFEELANKLQNNN